MCPHKKTVYHRPISMITMKSFCKTPFPKQHIFWKDPKGCESNDQGSQPLQPILIWQPPYFNIKLCHSTARK